MSDYQKLLNGIFMCGEKAVQTAAETEKADYIIDLRAETDERTFQDKNTEWFRFPLVDGQPGQKESLKEAIFFSVNAYKAGKTAILH
ncbi:hypothetical protein [Evansella clarkii]|jgi:hypothetical protein|uniref:hypothetical protein n=1 Tax=Evansella clarkii TaxID=79879 RepID=UPI000B42F80E|nr:hypothetical protein [Evansella clarkii]